MAAAYTVDQLTNLSIVEHRGENNGVIFELRREALVTGLDLTILGGVSLWRILQEALDTLPANEGVGFGSAPTGHLDLILVERIVRLIPGETTKCIVELVYKRLFSAIETVEIGTFIPRGGAGLRQFTTTRNQFGDDVEVCYTYPSSEADPNYPHTDPRLRGRTVCQAGEIQVDYPSDTLEFEGRLVAEFPGEIARLWRGSTNLVLWNGGIPGTWRCNEVSFMPWDIAPTAAKVWLFVFNFQFDPTGWNPDAIFRNQLTGRPPTDLITDVQGGPVIGIREVDWYPQLNFAMLFPP